MLYATYNPPLSLCLEVGALRRLLVKHIIIKKEKFEKVIQLFCQLEKGRLSGEENGWLSSEEVRKELKL